MVDSSTVLAAVLVYYAFRGVAWVRVLETISGRDGTTSRRLPPSPPSPTSCGLSGGASC